MDRASIKNLLASRGLKPLKKLGQNFLIDETTVKRILDFAKLKSSDTIVEIGPGPGVLTRHLQNKVKRVIAVELDKGFCGILKRKFSKAKQVEIVEGDILDYSYRGKGPYKVLGNIPYNISSAILEKFLKHEPRKPSLMLLTVQKELAERVVAKPPHTNRIALLVQYCGQARIQMRIGKRAFWPSPQVESCVLEIIPHKGMLSESLEKNMWDMIKRAFGQPRKKLSNTINLDKNHPLANLRPEELSLEDWMNIAQRHHVTS